VTLLARLAVLLALVLAPVVLFASPAAASHNYVDRRVSAIPATDLLTKDPPALVDPRRQQVAGQHALLLRGVYLLNALLQILALVYLWRSGNAARIRDALARSARNPIVLRFLFGAAVVTVATLAAVPAGVVSYRLDVAYALTPEPATTWLRDAIVRWLLAAAVMGALTAFVYTLVARTRLWYLYAAVGLFAFVLASNSLRPVVVAPLFDTVRAVGPAHPIAMQVRALARKAGLPETPVFVDNRSRRTVVATAQITGLGATERIILSDNLLDAATPAEVAFVIAQELGHFQHRDVVRLSLAWTVMLVLCIALGVAVADRVGFRRDDDALSRLPLVGALFGAMLLVALPAYNAYARRLDARADRYAVALTGDRASAVRAFVRLSDESLTPLCPSRIERDLFLDHPPPGSRIAAVLARPDPCP
jgi:STE24 endopeptidase